MTDLDDLRSAIADAIYGDDRMTASQREAGLATLGELVAEVERLRPSGIDLTTTGRGFYDYAEVTDDRQAKVTVRESSAASGPHVWLFCDSSAAYRDNNPGEASLHLNPEQARKVRDALTVFLEQIPERWSLTSNDGTEDR